MTSKHNTNWNKAAEPGFKLSVDKAVGFIGQWGVDRGIVRENGATVKAQLQKGLQELMETQAAIGALEYFGHLPSMVVEAEQEAALDGVGDTLTCIVQALRLAGYDQGWISGCFEEGRVFALDLFSIRQEQAFPMMENVADSYYELIQLMMYVYGEELNVFRIVSTLVMRLHTIFIHHGQLKGNPYIIRNALNKAWHAIKDRKGTMRDGIFYKEE